MREAFQGARELQSVPRGELRLGPPEVRERVGPAAHVLTDRVVDDPNGPLDAVGVGVRRGPPPRASARTPARGSPPFPPLAAAPTGRAGRGPAAGPAIRAASAAGSGSPGATVSAVPSG